MHSNVITRIQIVSKVLSMDLLNTTLKFLVPLSIVEGLYYPYSENKDADQLRGYREADLRLCFRICKNPVFS